MTSKVFAVCFLLIASMFVFTLANNEVNAQSGSVTEESLAKISERLEKIESQMNLVLENQEKTFYELKRGRYFTKRS